MYAFKPFVFTRHKPQSKERPKARSGHRIVCDDKNLYSFGGFNPSRIPDAEMRNDPAWQETKPLFKELWKFNFVTQQWTRMPGSQTLPNELASNAVVLMDNILLVFGGTGVPFGESCSNRLYAYDMDSGTMKLVSTGGNLPEPQYGQALIFDKPYLYTVGGTTGYEYTCDIHRLDLRTGKWEVVYICTGKDSCEPSGRYRHELAYDGRMIYVLGGGTSTEAFGFLEIPTFDLHEKKWMTLNTIGDKYDNSIPSSRRCHGSVQYKDENTGEISVIISGGFNGDPIFSDMWKLDLSNLQWTRLRNCVLPRPVYFHSVSLTPEGRMYTFGGINKESNKEARTAAVHSVWLRIPKLSEMCWEALNHYNLFNKWNKSPRELLLMGIPSKFVQRIEFYERPTK